MKHLLNFFSLCCICIFFTLNTFGQDDILMKIKAVKALKSESEKVTHYTSLLKDAEQFDLPEAQSIIYNELGLSYSKIKNYKKATDCLSKAIELRSQLKLVNVERLNDSRYDLSKIYKKMRLVTEQNQLLNSIIQEGRKDSITCRAHSDIGRNLALKGDYHSAIQYLNSVLADNELMQDVDHELIIRFKITFIYGLKYEDIFKAKKDSPDLDDFKVHFDAIEQKFDQSSLDGWLYFALLNNLATVSQAFEDGQQIAMDSYSKSLKYYKEQNDTFEIYAILSSMGTFYSKLGDHKKANTLYQKVIDNAIDDDQVASGYANKGFFLNVDSSKDKIPYFLNAYEVLLGEKVSDGLSFKLPTLEQIRSSNFELEFLTYLIDLAAILVESYKESEDTKYLQNAKEAIYLVDQLVSRIRYESLSEESKMYWIENGVDTYMLGVEVCMLLNQTDEAFYFMEKNKALLLQENIKTLQAKWEFDIPSEILEREYEMYYTRNDLYEELLDNPRDENLKREYAELNNSYSIFMDSLEHQYPGYSKTKQQVQITPYHQAVSDYVSDDKCFVEYILNDQDGYGIFHSSQKEIQFKISDIRQFQKDLKRFKSYLTKPILTKQETTEFQELGVSVFLQLFPFPDALEYLSDNQVIVISDQELNHIPFEALSVRTDLPLAESYLVNFCEISYIQSISTFEQIRRKENKPPFSLLGIAPTEFGMQGMSDLSMSQEAIKPLTQFKDSKVLMGEEATKSNFLSELDQYKVVHLNTHAGIDPFNLEPWIAFRDKKMGLKELYGKENQAELVVLDACKTNDGKLIAGEGILNLSRGFFYNGAQSVLASNWNVNEKTGNEIIFNFYDNLLKGSTKSQALRAAKTEFLKGHQYSEILPYYWAAYTITGNVAPVYIGRSSNKYIYFGLFVLVLILSFFVYYRLKL